MIKQEGESHEDAAKMAEIETLRRLSEITDRQFLDSLTTEGLKEEIRKTIEEQKREERISGEKRYEGYLRDLNSELEKRENKE